MITDVIHLLRGKGRCPICREKDYDNGGEDEHGVLRKPVS